MMRTNFPSMAQETILIVEDQPANRRLLIKLLAARKAKVLTADNGQEALKMAGEEKPDLVIADILMPKMDGYEFVKRLRDNPDIANTKVIYYTGNYAESESRTLAKACGVSRIINKAAEPHEILQAIDDVLETKTSAKLTMGSDAFEEKHLRLVTDKLSQKVNELENLNSDLERRVMERTEELAAANSRLKELNQMKDEFLAIVSHDLKTPLSGILIGAQTMVEQGEQIDPKRRGEILKQIAACAKEQITFVDDLLTLAQTERGKILLHVEKVRISEIINDSIRDLAPNTAAKGLTIHFPQPKNEPLILADRMRLSQVFNNLLTNAVKFTSANGNISVAMPTDHDDHVIVKITDTGMGIPSDLLPDSSAKFAIPQRLGTKGEGGTGLGLTIVSQIMDLHKGKIEVKSQPNRGTTFTLSFPCA